MFDRLNEHECIGTDETIRDEDTNLNFYIAHSIIFIIVVSDV